MHTLDRCPPGCTVLIVGFAGGATCQSALAARGLVAGTQVQVVRQGDPMLIAVGESRWALCRQQATACAIAVVE